MWKKVRLNVKILVEDAEKSALKKRHAANAKKEPDVNDQFNQQLLDHILEILPFQFVSIGPRCAT